MIKEVLKNDISTVIKQKMAIFSLIILIGIGLWSGLKFNLSISDGIAINSPYNLGFVIGLLSLTSILIGTILAFVLLFKEQDSHFSLIIFTTPVSNQSFSLTRFLSFYLLTLLSFFILILGFGLGLHLQSDAELIPVFKLWHFLYPFLLFGVLNSFLVCSFLFLIAQKSQSKLMVAIGGVFMYIVYMVVLVFSNAPFMAQALPQSLFVQKVSALVDPFGLSSYFYEAKAYTLEQRNFEIVKFSNMLLLNRSVVFIMSITSVLLGVKSFSSIAKQKTKGKKLIERKANTPRVNHRFNKVTPNYSTSAKWQSIRSFFILDATYLIKNTSLKVISILLLFYIGMEAFSDIDKGIRFPEFYASSGLLAQTINSNFYFLGALVVVYFVNDLYWRSESSRFTAIQNTTYYANAKLMGHFGSNALLIFYFTTILILEALIIQIGYNYLVFDWKAYLGVVTFNALPLFIFASFLLFINSISINRNIALIVSLLCFLIFASPLARLIINHPLLAFFSGHNGTYSDFSGYGSYVIPFLWRLVFGASIIAVLFLLQIALNSNKALKRTVVFILMAISLAIVSSIKYSKGYVSLNKEKILDERITYETNYRKYQSIPQPTIKKVITEIDLHPETQSYTISGSYIMVNQSSVPINSILVNVFKQFDIKSLEYSYKNEKIDFSSPVSELILSQGIQSKDSAHLKFQLQYRWHPVNKHLPFNAIVSNGSFMRISRFLPYFGYNEANEVKDLAIRKENHLEKPTSLKSLNAKRSNMDDSIDLEMLITTPENQTAIGTGKLRRHWSENGKNYFQYSAEKIPFRFALSSARYLSRSVIHNGVCLEILYHPLHDSNVDDLLANIKLALDYCTENYGEYPFETLKFAEVSSFTEGFNGTAYPGVVFMTEHMAFNTNLNTDKKQDVINELAGHEVAHFWWGNSQMDPDYREGYAMLTESLAMYTEMMIYKKLHGKQKMLERIELHRQIYEAEKGFHKLTPLIKATKDQPHISYSKGAFVLVEISELIGEDKMNLALKKFLSKHKYPNKRKPISIDLVEEILNVTKSDHKEKIKLLFMEV